MDNDCLGGGGRGGDGRGRGPRSASSSSRITMANNPTASTGGRRGRGSRGGRGGRGRGKSKLNASFRGQSYIDEEDEICQQALGQYELETSEISKALEKSEEASQLEGFDETAGEVWIYPTNKPIRDYQFEMVETALFHNTLVSLPTGLGKTFIAAVVMYNFQRWYPQGLIIFMAPTKPLVTQQMEACHNLVGIHPSKTIELTGQISPKKREELWKTKTVFFLTPQVMTSDLGRGFCPADKVRCIVVDEAHKALGQHAYAQAIQILLQTNTLFRVLALSATPGSDLIAVQQVFKNLLISRVELRSENSPDVLPYVHNRNVEPIVVSLDNYLSSIYQTVLEYLQVYTGKLLKNKALYGSDGYCFTQFQLVKSRAAFREKIAQTVPNYLKGYIESDFATSITLSHSVDLLTSHGLRSFYIFLQGVLNKEKGNGQVVYELSKNTRLQDLLNEIKEKLNISPNSSLNTSNFFKTISKNESSTYETNDESGPENYLISHPKMGVLKDIVLSHFKKFESRNETTRIMIFSQYRDSVQEIGLMLNGLGPLVKPMVFIGQATTGTGGKGLKQKDQVQVVSQFRDGGYNILVATCVGEEGLDIGEVDLIICFDASKSPTRLVQRMGRTGRQRQGKIVFLLTEGKEEKNYNASLSLQSSISKNITDPNKLYPFLYKHSPRMVPRGVDPQCFKMDIILTSEQDNQIISNHCKQDEDFVEIDEYPDSAVNIKPKSKQTKKSMLPPKKKQKQPTPQSSLNVYPESKPFTLTQCFNDLFKKSKPSPPKLVNSPPPIITTTTIAIPSPEITNNDVMLIEDEDGLIPHHHQQYEPIDSFVLCDIFDVLDPSEMSSKPCLHIPTPPESEFEWLPEYNKMDPDSLLIPEYEMDFIVQKMESFRSIMFYLDECECGNINIDGVGRKMINNNDSPSYSPLPTQIDDLQDGGLVEKEEVDQFFNDDDQWLLNVGEDYTKEVDPVKNEETFSTEPKKKFVFKIKNNTPLPTPPPPESIEQTITIENHNLQSPLRSRSTGIQHSSPAAAPIITISDGEASSSTTSNDEEFKSPNWRKRLSLQYKHPTSPPPSSNGECNPVRTNNDDTWKEELPAKHSQSQQFKSQIDPELFKDDMLLFDDDVQDDFEPDFEERPLTPTIYENIASQQKCQLEPTVRQENKSTFYNTNFIAPPSPPSIFSKNRHFTKLVSKPVPKSDLISNTDSDDEILELLNLTQIEQSAYRKSQEKLPINDSYKLTMNNPPKFTFKKSTSESTLKPCSSTSNPPKINDWIDLTHTNRPKNTNKLPQPESKKRSQTIKNPLLRPSPLPSIAARIPLKVRPSKLQFQDEKADWSDDDDFRIPGNRSKATKQTNRNLIKSPSPTLLSNMTTNSDTFASSSPLRAIPSSSSRNLNPTFCDISPIASTKQRKKRRKIEINSFLQLEAEVSENDDDDDDDDDGLDRYDTSFVDSDDEDVLTDSQQARYLKSVKDIHPNPGVRVEAPLESNNGNDSILIGDMNYASDSFCVNNDSVEFADIGVFTQAMNVARQEVLNERPSSTKRRRTRRQARAHNYEFGNSKKISLNKPSSKARRRIIVNEESSDEDEQF